MDIEQTKEAVKKEEGYRLETYKCTEGHLTGGYGHKMLEGEVPPTDHAGWLKIFERDFAKAMTGAEELLMLCPNIHETARHIVVEMVYQMGAYGVSRFKKFLQALQDSDYKEASVQMLDSRWAKQTPNRANRMSERMANI
jgi:lysozyme|tara:strand:- start:132 stop:551 length:420 start_codon:yes stop_codon:yes gene_type:complete